jgi:hypothetical protein
VRLRDFFGGTDPAAGPGPEADAAEGHTAPDDGAEGGRWWADEAVRADDDDDLGRGPFADRAAAVMASVARSPESTVVGLVGPWGSGKTSTINLILRRLDRDHWGVAKVNPWAVSGPDAVVMDLLAGIRSQLPPNSAARDAFDKYGAVAAPLLAGIPVVGKPASEAVNIVRSLLGEGTVQARIEKAAAALGKLARPVLIVVDDVDRLQPPELLALFKAVRVLGRLPHVHYLLAYDEQTVLDVLGATDIASGSPARALAFVEKIVTLRLDQPPVRLAQAEHLLRAGLDKALAADGVRLTDDQAQRLEEERNAFLLRTFTEPRAVARLLAQVRLYLPLVGPTEIDPADFVVVTALRITQPRLYRHILAEQGVLSGAADSPALEPALDRWRSPDLLGELDVHERDRPRVDSALRRLFPLLQAEQGVLQVFDRSTRRRDRRASDPDHVGRYLSLISDPDEISDARLSDALRAWADGDGASDTAAAVLRALRPSPDNPAACAAAARAMRRAEERAGNTAPATAAALLPTAVGLLAAVGETGPALHEVQNAAIGWTARLLTRADGPDPQDLLGLVTRPVDQASPLWPFLRALGLARAERPSDKPHADRLDRLADEATEAAWGRFAGHVAAGSTAPPEQTAGLLRWLDETVGQAETDRRLAALVRDGTPAADVAGRMIQTASLPGGGMETLVAFDAASAMGRLGRKAVAAGADALRRVASPAGTGPPDDDDVSWTNRSRLAATLLLEEIAADEAGEIRLPSPPAVEHPPLRGHRPETFQAPEQPDLRLQATFLLPAGPALPLPTAGKSGLNAKDREREAVRLMADSPMTAWLGTAGPRWHLQPTPWTVAQTEDACVTVAAVGRSPDQRGHWRLETPIMLGAQFRTGPGGDPESSLSLVVTVAAGLWLRELDSARKPSSTRHNDVAPLPAALTIAEAYGVLAALTSCVTTALNAFPVLVPDGPAVENVHVAVVVEAGDGPGTVVDLTGAERVPAGRNRHETTYSVRVDSLGGGTSHLVPGPDDLAAAVLNDWFAAAGHRGHEPELDRAWRRHLD